MKAKGINATQDQTRVMSESATVKLMEKTIKAQSRLLAAYRVGRQPPEWVFKALDNARKAGLEV